MKVSTKKQCSHCYENSYVAKPHSCQYVLLVTQNACVYENDITDIWCRDNRHQKGGQSRRGNHDEHGTIVLETHITNVNQVQNEVFQNQSEMSVSYKNGRKLKVYKKTWFARIWKKLVNIRK